MNLSNAKISANVKVSDLDRAKKFYSEKLGLKIIPMTDGFAAAVSKDGSLISLAMSARAGVDNDYINFTVENIKDTIAELKKQGVEFMDYDTPNLKTVDHISEYKGFQAAWFKDSEGNVIGINQPPS